MTTTLRLPELRHILAGVCLLFALAAQAAGPASITMGTEVDETTFAGKWMRKIYFEAFKRLAIPLEVVVFPTKRLSVAVDEGVIDGEFLRIYDYANAHPNLVRVEVPVLEVAFALYVANPELRLARLEDLPATTLSGEYRRGMLICETMLKPLLPPERMMDINTTEQGLKKLLAKRSDFYCDNDNAVLSELIRPEFKDAAPVRKLIELKLLPLYPYLHRKRAELAPALATALKQMKAEGLIERYRQDSLQELSVQGK